MRRIAAAAALALAAVTAVPAHAFPGGTCEGEVDFQCRDRCVEDELDCGMKPVCLVWVGGVCVFTNP